MALAGMEPVGGRVARVVDEVGAARRKAERQERNGRGQKRIGLIQHPGCGRSSEDEDVLQPLLGAAGTVEAAEARRALRRRGGAFGGGRRHVGPILSTVPLHSLVLSSRAFARGRRD